MGVEYREEPCRTALNRVKGMPFEWSLNPYSGCAHRCTFCYVRGFEQRAGRPGDGRYGVSIRIKVNVAEVLRRELSRRSWRREAVAFGTEDVTAPIDAALTQLRGDWQVERRPRPQRMRSSGSRQLELPLIQPGV